MGKILQSLLTIWGIVTLLYLVFYVFENPVEYMLDEKANQKTRDAVIQKYGLDKPLYVQYTLYLYHLSPIGWKGIAEEAQPVLSTQKSDFGYPILKKPQLGNSYQTDRPVTEMIQAYWGGTAILALAALAFAAIVGIGLGVIAVQYHQKWPEKWILSLSVLGVSVPSFFGAVLLIWIFAVLLRPYTHFDATGYLFEPDVFTGEDKVVWKNLVLPTLALGIRPLAVFIQLTRSAMLEVIRMDFVRTAYAKGLSHQYVTIRHVLRNALNPVITSITGWFASLLAGAFFIEYIFNWKGLGKLTIEALYNRDFPVILGCTLCVGVIFVGMKLLTDVIYRFLDPRIR